MGSGLAVALGPPQEVIPKLCEGANVTVAKVQVGCHAGIPMGQSGEHRKDMAMLQGYCSEEQREV